MPCVRDVAGGEHVPGRGLKSLVDENAVVDLEAGVAGQLGAGRDTDSDDDGGPGECGPARGAHARDRAVAFERLRTVAEQQLDTVLRMHSGIEAADLEAEDPL